LAAETAALLLQEIDLCIQGEVDVFAYHEAAVLHLHVKDHAEVFPVDPGLGPEAEAGVDFPLIIKV
jgi:hypothetical protein